MTERLVIRLGSHAEQAISWLTWSDSEQEIIASGTLSNAAELVSLSERASQGVVQILVPGTDVGLFSVELPTTNRRQALKTIPFMLEDELAADIDLLHFVHGLHHILMSFGYLQKNTQLVFLKLHKRKSTICHLS